MSFDLILLHAPSVYDFRKKTILYGPVADLIPSSPMFELYPIGFASIAEYMEKNGYRVRIVNLAFRMLNDWNFDVEKFIKKLKAPVFGIDLHWLIHSHGSIEIAKLVKKYHSESKVIFGGLSSSYFYNQLMEFPEIDFVLRGDTTEEPFRQLLEALKTKKSLESIPNLVWRDNGKVRENEFTHVPTDISHVMVKHYDNMIKSTFRTLDLTSHIPFKGWLNYPITAVLTCKGCKENCVICGGSAFAFRNSYHRPKPVFRSPEAVANDVKRIEKFSSGPIFILGDLCQRDDKYADEVLTLLEDQKVKNQIIFELFNPCSGEVLRRMAKISPNFCLEITPETHDEVLRKAAGRNYSNADMERSIGDALNAGCGRVDIFFMIGLPKQTVQSVRETIDYCEYLMKKFNGDKRIFLFIAPLSPFLDPGSLGFEQPQKFGYHKQFKTLKEHRESLLSPSWKYSLNYETDWLTRQQIVDISYEAILKLNDIKARYGVISKEMAEQGAKRIRDAAEMAKRIDAILAGGNAEVELARIKDEVDRVNAFPIAEKRQLELPVGLFKMRIFRYLWSWATGQ